MKKINLLKKEVASLIIQIYALILYLVILIIFSAALKELVEQFLNTNYNLLFVFLLWGFLFIPFLLGVIFKVYCVGELIIFQRQYNQKINK